MSGHYISYIRAPPHIAAVTSVAEPTSDVGNIEDPSDLEAVWLLCNDQLVTGLSQYALKRTLLETESACTPCVLFYHRMSTQQAGR